MKDPHDAFTQEIPPLTRQRKRGPGRPPDDPAGAKSGAQRIKEHRARQKQAGNQELRAMVSNDTLKRVDVMRGPQKESRGEFLDRIVEEEWKRFEKKK